MIITKKFCLNTTKLLYCISCGSVFRNTLQSSAAARRRADWGVRI